MSSEHLRTGRMHLHILADAADFGVTAHQRPVLFQPEAQKLFIAEMRQSPQKNDGFDHGLARHSDAEDWSG